MLKARIEQRYELVTADLNGLVEKLKKEVNKKVFFRDFVVQDRMMHRFSWMLEKDKDELNKDDIKEAGEQYLDQVWDDFEEDFYDKAKEQNGKITGYRCLTLDEKKITKFISALQNGKYLKGFSGIGKWFAWDEEAARCHWGGGRAPQITVVAEIPISSIDFKGMAWANMTASEEKEITLKPGSKIFIQKILDSDGKNLLGDDIKELPAVAEV